MKRTPSTTPGRRRRSEEEEERPSSKKKPSTTAKKKPVPRDPLKDLNTSSSFAPPRCYAEAQKGGCFRFLLSGSSSSKQPSYSSSRSQPRTPKSAPPNAPAKSAGNSCKLRVCRNAQKNPSLSPIQLGSKKRQKPDLLQTWNRNKHTSENLSGGKDGDSELRFEMSLGGGDQFGHLRAGSFLDSTPERIVQGFGSEVKEGERKLSITPSSDATPPIEASISPEIVNGACIGPAPVCFAAGHVVAGVQDRRKCRPRGMLTVGIGGGLEITEDPPSGFGDSNESRVSSVAPPLSGASIQWLSPLSENANPGRSGSSSSRVQMGRGYDEASVNWLLSRPGNADEAVLGSGRGKISALVSKVSSDEHWSFSPLNEDSSGLMGLYSPGLSTPSSGSGYGARRTPTSGSSTSPFSAILQRAAASSGLVDHKQHQKKGRHCYGSVVDELPMSAGTWGHGNVMSTPLSSSSSRKHVILSPTEIDSMTENLRKLELSPRPKVTNDASFQFKWPAAPSSSIDRLQYSYNKSSELCLNEQSSDLRISWHEGLVSRIFERDELDHSRWLSDDEGAHKLESEFSLNSDQNDRSTKLQGGGKRQTHGSGSIEFACTETGSENIGGKVPPPSSAPFAESISTEGIDGLISSGDSDCALFYKNHLFEV